MSEGTIEKMVEQARTTTLTNKLRIFDTLLKVADESSLWITECSLTADDKEAAVLCLAEVAGAVRMTELLLGKDKVFDLADQ